MCLDPFRRSSIALRTRRLYALAFVSCGSSHRAVQRCIGRDVRSIVVARDVPTLGCVIDLSRALGMRAGAIIDILSSGVPGTDPEHPGLDLRPAGDGDGLAKIERLADIADLADDATQLEHLAEALPHSQCELRRAMLARALTARGATERAIMLVGGETCAVADRHDADPRMRRLLAAVVGEIALVRPNALRTPPLQKLAGALVLRPPARSTQPSGEAESHRRAFEARAETHRAACAVALADDDDVALARLSSLAESLEEAHQLGLHVASAWAASATALAALALIEHRLHDSAAAGPALRIAVRAGFVLEDVVRCGDPLAERLACARRARTILAERAVRIACGEDPSEVADTADLAEFRMAALRFPDADPCLHPFRDFRTFSQPSEIGA